MFQIDTKAEKLQTILSLLNKDTISPSQLGRIISTLITIVKKAKADNDVLTADIKAALSKTIEYVDNENEKLLTANDADFNKKVIAIEKDAQTKINSFLKEARTILLDLKTLEIEPGEPGYTPVKGVDYFDGEDGSPDSAEDIVNKLNGLEGVLDWKVLKNVPESSHTIVHEGGFHAGAMETPLVDFTTGKLLPKNAQGAYRVQQSTGSTPNFVDNEVVSGSATTWNLASTPVVSSVHVFANGQRLIPTTDYSISGATITTVLSWDAGTVLADYRT